MATVIGKSMYSKILTTSSIIEFSLSSGLRRLASESLRGKIDFQIKPDKHLEDDDSSLNRDRKLI